jgi:hypothetical protein
VSDADIICRLRYKRVRNRKQPRAGRIRIRSFALLFDAHLIADTAHVLNTVDNFGSAVDLALMVDEATELDCFFARYDSDVEAIDDRTGKQRGLDN